MTLTGLRAHVGRLRGRRDATRLRQVLELADPCSGSVLDSVLRVRMVQDGLRGFTTQTVLRDSSGRHVLRADFCFEHARLVVEVDGARWHPDGDVDRRRDNALACSGWRVLRFTWGTWSATVAPSWRRSGPLSHTTAPRTDPCSPSPPDRSPRRSPWRAIGCRDEQEEGRTPHGGAPTAARRPGSSPEPATATRPCESARRRRDAGCRTPDVPLTGDHHGAGTSRREAFGAALGD